MVYRALSLSAYAACDLGTTPELCHRSRKPGQITEAGCWAHARRKFFELAKFTRAPLAAEAVGRIDAIFAIERDINAIRPDQRRAARTEQSAELVNEPVSWLRQTRVKLARNKAVGRAMDYM